ncbi:cytochrome P460 family protein [Pseudomonas sp. S9]|uniref:cytochrome P460 family protein n=1 Tax=Pseudomonas sp. S9 TaxID=686578 RepID=UPI000A0126E4|nr:cytochrome P460 family protein [Pseudomonas sp. S9]
MLVQKSPERTNTAASYSPPSPTKRQAIPPRSPALKNCLPYSILLAACLLSAGLATAAEPDHPYAAISDAAGNLHVPANYRNTYQFLGSWAVAADKGQGAKQLHVVYASPNTGKSYKKLGHFPDGTVLVKEVFDTSTAGMTTGTVSHATTLKGWFVMVKDSKHAYPQSKLWGDGWGWSWFDANQPNVTTTKDHNECLGCHQPARSSDLVYVQGYPTLAE